MGSYLPDQGSNPRPLQWKFSILPTDTPGKPLFHLFVILSPLFPEHTPWTSFTWTASHHRHVKSSKMKVISQTLSRQLMSEWQVLIYAFLMVGKDIELKEVRSNKFSAFLSSTEPVYIIFPFGETRVSPSHWQAFNSFIKANIAKDYAKESCCEKSQTTLVSGDARVPHGYMPGESHGLWSMRLQRVEKIEPLNNNANE